MRLRGGIPRVSQEWPAGVVEGFTLVIKADFGEDFCGPNVASGGSSVF